MTPRKFNVLQRMCDSEISFSIVCVACINFDVALGDEMNGYVAKENFALIIDAVRWLQQQTVEHLPNSQFACDETGREFSDLVVEE